MARRVVISVNDDEYVRRLKTLFLEWQDRRKRQGKSYSAVDFARVAGYGEVSRSKMTHILNGETKLPREGLECFSRELGCRVEYLLCIDKFRTVEGMVEAGGVEYEKCMDDWVHLLELLHYTVERRLGLYVSSYKELSYQWDVIKPVLTDETLAMPINENGQTFNDWDGVTPIASKYLKEIYVKKTVEGSETNHYEQGSDYRYSLYFILINSNGDRAFWNMDDLETVTDTIYEHAGLIVQRAFKKNQFHGELEIDEPDVAKD